MINNSLSPSPLLQNLNSLGLTSSPTGFSTNTKSPASADTSPLDFGRFDANLSTSALDLDPGSVAPSPFGHQPLSLAQGLVASSITGPAVSKSTTEDTAKAGQDAVEEKKGEKKSTTDKVLKTAADTKTGADLTEAIASAPEKLVSAGEGLAGHAAKFGKFEGAATKAGKFAIRAGEVGKDFMETVPGVEKAAHYVGTAAGLLGNRPAHALAKGVQGHFALKEKDARKAAQASKQGGKDGVKAAEGGTKGSATDGAKATAKDEAKAATSKAVKSTVADTSKEVTKDATKAATKDVTKAAAKDVSKAAVKAVEKTVVKEGVEEGAKIAGKAGSSLIPGLGAVVAVAASGYDAYDAHKRFAKGDKVGGWIESAHAVTDLAGTIPVVGTAVSLIGDGLAVGAHWLTHTF